MPHDLAALSALLLMFALGLRHGLDPDHIAMIDAMTYRSLEQRPAVAPWIGTLFAAGHGLTVTALAVILSSLTSGITLPASVVSVLDWLPVALLLLVGSMNLRALLAPGAYRAVGWKQHVLPSRLQDSSHPFAIFMVGVVFALVFDSATQAAAWGSVASAQAGAGMALAVGLAFTAGMIITDTADSRLMCRLLQRGKPAEAQVYRRRIGWLVVLLAYSVALYSIGTHFYPAFELSDATLSAAGLVMFVLLIAVYVRAGRHASRPRLG